MKHKLVAFLGIPGSGKTTAANLFSSHGFSVFEENFENNHFLADFYLDMKRWAFHSQMFFLTSKIKQVKKIRTNLLHSHVMQDFPLLQDVAYAKTTHSLGNMSEPEWELYFDTFQLFNKNLKQPDLVVYLKVDPETALERIAKRARDFEQNIEASYLASLTTSIESLLSEFVKKGKSIEVDARKINLVENKSDINKFIKLVNSNL